MLILVVLSLEIFLHTNARMLNFSVFLDNCFNLFTHSFLCSCRHTQCVYTPTFMSVPPHTFCHIWSYSSVFMLSSIAILYVGEKPEKGNLTIFSYTEVEITISGSNTQEKKKEIYHCNFKHIFFVYQTNLPCLLIACMNVTLNLI